MKYAWALESDGFEFSPHPSLGHLGQVTCMTKLRLRYGDNSTYFREHIVRMILHNLFKTRSTQQAPR